MTTFVTKRMGTVSLHSLKFGDSFYYRRDGIQYFGILTYTNLVEHTLGILRTKVDSSTNITRAWESTEVSATISVQLVDVEIREV